MSDITPGVYRIVSLTEGKPAVGIDHSRVGGQNVILDGPIQRWIVEKHHDHLVLRIGGYAYTGLLHNKVHATINGSDQREWHATHRVLQNAYTIELAGKPDKGWTVSADTELDRREVELKLIVATKSLPPRYLPTQLFRFEPILRDEL